MLAIATIVQNRLRAGPEADSIEREIVKMEREYEALSRKRDQMEEQYQQLERDLIRLYGTLEATQGRIEDLTNQYHLANDRRA